MNQWINESTRKYSVLFPEYMTLHVTTRHFRVPRRVVSRRHLSTAANLDQHIGSYQHFTLE